jgi:chromosome segregation ATPase
MAVCPRCGTEVTKPTKKWFIFGKPTKIGEQSKLTLALFTCANCEKRFRKVVLKEKEKTTFKGMVKEIKGIEMRLMQTLGDLREKIEKLKSERAELLEEIEELKKAGEKKARTLEKEVTSLREEVESLKDMLGDL